MRYHRQHHESRVVGQFCTPGTLACTPGIHLCLSLVACARAVLWPPPWCEPAERQAPPPPRPTRTVHARAPARLDLLAILVEEVEQLVVVLVEQVAREC
eukprot:354903-Chlamydomonas_euryale.AAC.30